jgi:hypothetical protein
MKTINILLFVLASAITLPLKAQDSAKVANTLHKLVTICKNVDFGDPKTLELGTFYKAAPFIAYQGSDDKRKWKDAANYQNVKEKEQVDQICFKINQSVNQDSSYRIVAYRKEKESEGEWHVLRLSYVKKGKERNAVFAFLKIGEKYLLGDID